MTIYSLSAKNCMSHLLLKETFDQFSFIEAEFTTWGKFRLDGYLQEDFFDRKTRRDLRPLGKSPRLLFPDHPRQTHPVKLQDHTGPPG